MIRGCKSGFGQNSRSELAIVAVLLLVFLCGSLRTSAASAFEIVINAENAEVRSERRDNLLN
jgi:hypothetical protein